MRLTPNRPRPQRVLQVINSSPGDLAPVFDAIEAIAYVTDFIAKINASSLADNEKFSLIGSLRLLQKESVTQAGKRLATRILGQKLYDGKTAPTFFSDAYSLRGALVHGNLPEPEAISRISTPMELFVSDLLTIPLLGSV